MKSFLGIDLGTGGVRAVLLAHDGAVAGSGFGDIPLAIPAPGFAQQSPADWLKACVIAVRQAVASCKTKPAVAGIGISGQMLGSVLLDKKGAVLDDCIIWMDQRAGRERDQIEQELGIGYILDKTANYPLTSYWAPKLLWLQNNKPAVFEKIDKVLFPKDYLKYMLTGVLDIDVTDATGSMLFNTAKRAWEPELFDKLSLPRGIVPGRASESANIIGKLTVSAAETLGLQPGIPVVAGGGDQMCGAVGTGVVRPGVISSTIGTSGVVFSFSDACVVDRQPRAALSYCHSVPGKWCMYGCTLAAGGSLRWLRDTFFRDAATKDKSAYAAMDELAASAQPGCEGLVFLPYLNGERTPYPDPDARGVFFGLSSRHGAGEICRAVMEGVVFSLRDTVEIIREYGSTVSEARASGGGANSMLWLQMQADIFDAVIAASNIAETPAVGAAMLAAVGTGHFAGVEQAADTVVKPVLLVEPDAQNVKIYEEYYATYRSLYPALKNSFRQQAETVKKTAPGREESHV